MPNYIQGNLWDSKADIIAVTTNGTIRNNELVMGAGAALQAKIKYPDLPGRFGGIIRGQSILRMQDNIQIWLYGFEYLIVQNRAIGFFQTKTHYSSKSNLALIGYSIMQLNVFLLQNPKTTVAMNFPGVGYGGLPRTDVEKVLSALNPLVDVYYKGLEYYGQSARIC